MASATAPGPLQDQRAGQAAAIEALLRSLEPGKPPSEVVALLLKDLVLAGEGVMNAVETICASAAPKSRDVAGAHSSAPTVGAKELVARVVEVLQKQRKAKVGDIVGQILWRHRKADALQERRFKKIAESVEWAVAEDLNSMPELLELVDGVFKEYTVGEKGRMSCPQWRKIAKIIQANPVLNSRLKRTDIDRLYYAETHSRGGAQSSGVSRREFKSLLVQLAGCMGVPPYMVLLAVGSHNHQAEHEHKAAQTDEEPQYMCKRLSDM